MATGKVKHIGAIELYTHGCVLNIIEKWEDGETTHLIDIEVDHEDVVDYLTSLKVLCEGLIDLYNQKRGN